MGFSDSKNAPNGIEFATQCKDAIRMVISGNVGSTPINTCIFLRELFAAVWLMKEKQCLKSQMD